MYSLLACLMSFLAPGLHRTQTSEFVKPPNPVDGMDCVTASCAEVAGFSPTEMEQKFAPSSFIHNPPYLYLPLPSTSAKEFDIQPDDIFLILPSDYLSSIEK